MSSAHVHKFVFIDLRVLLASQVAFCVFV